MSEKEPQQREEPQERASDEEIATFLMGHIDKPCEVNIGEEVKNIRDFYIKEANWLLNEKNSQRITDKIQAERLQKKIDEYKPE